MDIKKTIISDLIIEFQRLIIFLQFICFFLFIASGFF